MTQALLGLKAAYEKAQQANGGKAPSQDQVIAAFENLEYQGPGGTVRMALGKGHQAVMDTTYGEVKHEQGKAVVTNVRSYTAEQVNPPDGMQSEAWIKNDLKPASNN
jgi:branched-chain amino acid transport system substrate-binding protein